jgi:hypothetical protein
MLLDHPVRAPFVRTIRAKLRRARSSPRPWSQRSHCLYTAGAPRVRAIGNVCPLRMNGIYALVIGGTDERL